MSSPRPAKIVRFGAFEADLRTLELRKQGLRLRVPNQSFLVLAVLLERPGELVTREELRQRLWPSDTFVDYEHGLNAAVKRLRDVLGDAAENPRFIETLPKRGYRFLGTTEVVSENFAKAAPGVSATSSQRAPMLLAPDEVGPDSIAPFATRHPGEPLGAVTRRKYQLIGGILTLALFVVGVLVIVSRLPNAPNFSSPVVVPFTSLSGQEVAPTFSPDGSQIAFAWSSDPGKGFDLYVKTVGSEQMLQITDHPSKWISSAWSPDGTQIAFARLAGAGSGIFVVPALGGPERKLADAGFWYEPFMQVSWTPDAKSLAFSSTTEQGSQIFLLPLDTLRTSRLNPGLHCWDITAPSFSRDGKNLAFVCTSSVAVYGLYDMQVSGGAPRLLASMSGYFRGLTWSADGSRIIFSNDSGDGGTLWQVTRAGRLTKLPFGEEASNPSIASKGNQLAYARGRMTINIWRLNLRSQHPDESATKLIYSTRLQRVPQYSPDGKKIVFESDRSGTHEIWLADADGNNPVQLTSFNGPLTGSPNWCSDGRRIAFDSRASGSSAIYVEDINERVPQQLKTDVQNLAIPTWSEDCQWLFASDGHDNLYQISFQGGPATRISDKGSWFSTVKNGKVFFNVKEANGVSLWSKPVSGGKGAALKGMPKLDSTESWTATVQGIYYSSSSSTPPAINFYDFATQTARPLLTLVQSTTPGGGLSVSSDGKWLLYTRTADAQSDIMLVKDFR